MFPWNQLLDIMDTVVKIGLGAAISGILTYKLTRLNYDGEIRKTRWLRQCEMLEACGDKAEKFFWATDNFISVVDGTKTMNEKNKTSKFTEPQLKGIGTRDGVLLESRQELQSVIARLRLLGAKDAARELVAVGNLVSDFRDPLILDKVERSSSEIFKFRSELRSQISKFHDALNHAYDKLNPSLLTT